MRAKRRCLRGRDATWAPARCFAFAVSVRYWSPNPSTRIMQQRIQTDVHDLFSHLRHIHACTHERDCDGLSRQKCFHMRAVSSIFCLLRSLCHCSLSFVFWSLLTVLIRFAAGCRTALYRFPSLLSFIFYSLKCQRQSELCSVGKEGRIRSGASQKEVIGEPPLIFESSQRPLYHHIAFRCASPAKTNNSNTRRRSRH